MPNKISTSRVGISPAMCRAARALVDLTQRDLAAAASISINVVVDFEKARRTPNRNNLAAIQRALEEAGVEFLNDGLRLKPAG